MYIIHRQKDDDDDDKETKEIIVVEKMHIYIRISKQIVVFHSLFALSHVIGIICPVRQRCLL